MTQLADLLAEVYSAGQRLGENHDQIFIVGIGYDMKLMKMNSVSVRAAISKVRPLTHEEQLEIRRIISDSDRTLDR